MEQACLTAFIMYSYPVREAFCSLA